VAAAQQAALNAWVPSMHGFNVYENERASEMLTVACSVSSASAPLAAGGLRDHARPVIHMVCGAWLHVDNPDGLREIMLPAFS